MSIINVEFLVTNDFERRRYPDGWFFWILKAHDELFLQVQESNNRVSLYNNGWVEDMLTDEELISTIKQFKELPTE